MFKIRSNRCFLTNLMYICAILFNVQLINTETTNGDISLEASLPDLMPNEDVTINSTDTSHITISSIEEYETGSTVNIPNSTITQIEEDQTHILVNKQTSSTLDIVEETPKTIEYNIKHEISNPPAISAIESRIIPELTEKSNTQLLAIPDSQLNSLDMGEFKIKVQKCCPSGQIMVYGEPGQPGICQESNEIFDIPVFCANLTHYWNCTSTAASNVEIVSRDPCKQRYFLDPNDESDTFRLLSNTSLYMPNSLDMFNNNQYCVDTIKGNEVSFTTAIICTTPPPKINIVFEYSYMAGLLLSIISLIILAVCSRNRKDIKDDHKKCITFFASSMATAFIFDLIHTAFHSSFNYAINVMILYLIYYLKLNFYLWLNMLSYDTYRCVRDSTIDTVSYMKWYLIATISIPFILVLLTFIGGFIPPLPYVYLGHMFTSSLISVILLYVVPVALSILGNIIVILSYTLPKERYANAKDLIASFQSKDWKAPPRNIKEIKKIRKTSWFLFIIIIACFILDIVIFFVPAHFFIRDVIYCLQGFLVTLTLMNYKTKNFCLCSNKSNTTPPNDEVNDGVEFKLIGNGNV